MTTTSSEQRIRGLVAGDATAIDALVGDAATSDDPAVLVAASLAVPAWQPLLHRAAAAAVGAADRRLVAVATAYLAGDTDRALLLARDHLADHPESVLVAYIAARAVREEESR